VGSSRIKKVVESQLLRFGSFTCSHTRHVGSMFDEDRNANPPPKDKKETYAARTHHDSEDARQRHGLVVGVRGLLWRAQPCDLRDVHPLQLEMRGEVVL